MKSDVKDIAAGLAISLFGLYFFLRSFGYGLGTATRMGPGFFPMLVGALTILMGLIIMVPAFARSGTLPAIAWRPLTAVLTGVAAFAISLQYLGFVPAVFLCICLCSLADRFRPKHMLVLAVCASIVFWLLFIKGLALQIPAFGGM